VGSTDDGKMRVVFGDDPAGSNFDDHQTRCSGVRDGAVEQRAKAFLEGVSGGDGLGRSGGTGSTARRRFLLRGGLLAGLSLHRRRREKKGED
jgi:hypothetical protein